MTAKNYYLLAEAEADLLDQAAFLAEHGSQALMRMFLEGVFSTARMLTEFPMAGMRCQMKDNPFAGMRRFPVHRMPQTILFYIPHAQGIDLFRILDSRHSYSALVG